MLEDSLALLTLGQAARACNRSKSTISRHIQAGKLPAQRSNSGGWLIRPEDLEKALPTSGTVPELSRNISTEVPEMAESTELAVLRREVKLLNGTVADLRGTVADLKEDRDHWRAQAEETTCLLSEQRSKRRRWWPFGK